MKSMKIRDFSSLLRELAALYEDTGRSDLANALRSLTDVFEGRENLTIDQVIDIITKARISAAA